MISRTTMVAWVLFGVMAEVGVFGAWASARQGHSETGSATSRNVQAAKPEAVRVVFEDVTEEAGIRFIHENGGTGNYYYPETFGSGVCEIDYDRDGDPDLVFVDGAKGFFNRPPERMPGKGRGSVVLYGNNGDGTFSDRTAQTGISVRFYGMGCAVGDYDNDGFHDLFVTGYGGQFLFHNEGNGRFKEMGLAEDPAERVSRPGPDSEEVEVPWSTSSLWFDYDRDGYLDLFVGHYVRWTPERDLWCTIDGKSKSFCGPEPYAGQTNRLYHNKGDGTFEDATAGSGILNPRGKTLGVAMWDVDENGWMDLAVANDMVPNFLYVNLKGERFQDQAVQRGFSASETGLAKAGMGIDVADFKNNGSAGILIGNFAHEQLSLFVRREEGIFLDDSPRLGTALPSHYFLTFGLFFFDFNLDGLMDILTANGHVDRHAPLITKGTAFRQRPQLFRQGKGTGFEEIGLKIGEDFSQPVVGRGAAYLDYDLDGDLDVVLTENDGEARLFRNVGGNQNNWLRVALIGKKSNRDGIGAVVKVSSGKHVLRSLVKSGSSYLSQSELPLTIGLGESKEAEWLEIRWPSGVVDRYTGLKGNRAYIFEEGFRREPTKP